MHECTSVTPPTNKEHSSTHLLGKSGPGFLQPKHGALRKGGHDLEDAVEVLEEATDIGDGRPLLHLAHSLLHVPTHQNLRHNQPRDLIEASAEQRNARLPVRQRWVNE